ncbi:MAG: hypothetical protein CMH55_08275 [Myxococcales bacterium]|nr:hypothetical protein [Myxococcales bacterium]
MRHQIILLVSLGLMTGCSGGHAFMKARAAKASTGKEDQITQLKEQAAAHWANRHDPEALKKAIATWEQVVAISDDVEVLTSLARANYFLSDAYLRFQGEGEGMLETYQKGLKAAEQALFFSSPAFRTKMEETDGNVGESINVIGKESLPAAYWYATNLGKWARKKGFAVVLGQKSTIQAIMSRVEALDDPKNGFFHGAVPRYWGAFYSIAPAFAGGDMDKSAEYFKKSLEIAPFNMTTVVLRADLLYTKQDDKANYEKSLKQVMAFNIESLKEVSEAVYADLAPELAREKVKAKALLEESEDRF